MTPYSTVFKRFLQKIEDRNLAIMSKNDRDTMLMGWLDSALSFMEFDDINTADYMDRNDATMIFNTTLSNKDIELIALYMVVAWYEPLVNSLEHTLSFVGSKDDNYKDSDKHMTAMKNTQEEYHQKALQYWNNYTLKHNTYLNEK